MHELVTNDVHDPFQSGATGPPIVHNNLSTGSRKLDIEDIGEDFSTEPLPARSAVFITTQVVFTGRRRTGDFQRFWVDIHGDAPFEPLPDLRNECLPEELLTHDFGNLIQEGRWVVRHLGGNRETL